ncbi:FAD-dependent oxidoreductase [Amycolatopsis sp. 195334CR]|nr:FAD-dependent oxidoreductase [Amycolatopsis sp. 195334CR]
MVGASVGGLTVAEALRHKGYTGSLRIVGEESHPPYDRPPLSKEVLTGTWPVERTHLRDEQRLAALDADWLLGRTAERLRPADHAVELDDGRVLTYDALVIATGLKPRRLPGQPHLAGVHTLRTLDETLALKRELQVAQRVSVVGAGVLGCEVAAAARTLGKAVTLIDPEPVPMLRTLGHELGGRVAELHRSRGVRLRTGTTVSRLVGENGRVTGIALPGGELVETELVVLALGSVPATGWLAGSGLTLDDGLRCDSTLRAADDVYAVGDVARWSDPATGTTHRLETRTNATEQALVVAANLLGGQRHHRPVPYFWSDQYEIKIQVHGVLGPHARLRLLDHDDSRFAAVAEENGTTTAAIGWNHPRGVRTARRHLAA